mgnify:CR=1 FL=1
MILGLVDDDRFVTSFQFISNQLQPYREFLYYIPLTTQQVDVKVIADKMATQSNTPSLHFKVHHILVKETDVTRKVYPYIRSWNCMNLKQAIVKLLFAPHSKVRFEGMPDDDQTTFEF